MGALASKMNNKCSFDFDAYLREREELAEDLRSIAKDAASHRQFKGSWQVIQGASGVAAGIAGGVALVSAPLSFPIAATTAMIFGKSVTAASLASSAATYGYGHNADKDIATRLQNLRHVIESISRKDKEISSFVKAPNSSTSTRPISNSYSNESNKENLQESGQSKACDNSIVDESGKNNRSSRSTKSTKTISTDSKNDSAIPKGNKKSSVTPLPDKEKRKQQAIQACQNLCKVWNEWDLATKKGKSIAFDLGLALVKSLGLFMGAHSMVEGSKQVREEQDLETALVSTADMIHQESLLIRQLDLRYLSAIPSEKRLPRGRLMHLDGGGGQVNMVVTFHRGHETPQETLKSDSTNSIRLPEGATNITVKFIDRSGTIVKRVNRSAPQQPWVTSDDGKQHKVEECKFDNGDGVDAVFVVKGCVTYAYIHKAWDFGRIREPRSWEWWDNVDEESKELLPDIEARSRLARSTAAEMDSSCGLELCGMYDGPEEAFAPMT